MNIATTEDVGIRAPNGRSSAHLTIRMGALKPLLAAFLTFTAACQAIQINPTPPPTAVQTPASTSMAPTHEWVLVDLPPDATQLQYGAEVYRLVCSACHGDRGQGLTAAWRATWAPTDQNCWQSKCHGPNHPPDGFQLPVAPAITGAGTLSAFATAQELHDFIQAEMPWQNPNSLTEKDSWSVTATLLKMNGIDPGPRLGPETAVLLKLGR